MTLNPNSIPANPIWRPGPDGPKLRGREAHVWRVDYRLHRPAGFESLLSSFEHERALKFLQPGIRDRYVIRRGVLRILLGRYLGRDGGSVMIQCGPFGKPYLSPGQGRDGLEFNLSTSQDYALIAFSFDPVGVDLESLDRRIDVMEIAPQVYSAQGLARLRTLPPAGREAAFFHRWTAIEACVKCSGEGIGTELKPFEFSEPDQSGRFDGARGPSRWALTRLSPAPRRMASLATSKAPDSVSCFGFE